MPRFERNEGLFERLASFENLYQAAAKAKKGKRFKHATARFHHDLAPNLVGLRDELLAGRYRPGAYHTFEIYEPAHRMISAAPYRDRVVHHALCNVIEPLFERGFISDSYANRAGKARTRRWIDARITRGGAALFCRGTSGCSFPALIIRS